MTRTLQDGLRKAGLVAEPEKRSDKDQNYIQRKLESYPLNRLGKPVMWAKWLVRRRAPKNVIRRCCLCGLSVRKQRVKNELSEDYELTNKLKEEFGNKNLPFDKAMVCKSCA